MKNTKPPHREPSNPRHTLVFLLAAILLFSAPAPSLAAGGEPKRYHDSGILTAVEGKSSVIIDEKGYDLYPSVVVENTKGRQIPLSKLITPCKITFDYSYMSTDPKTIIPVIVYIKETQKPAGNKRRSR